MNVSDSERIAAILEKGGCKQASNINEADLVVFNTCRVRQMAEDRVYGQIHNLKTRNAKRVTIVLTGCLANRKDVQRRLKNKVDLFTDIKNFPEKIKKLVIPSKVEGSNLKTLLDSSTPFHFAQNDNDYLKIIPKYKSNFEAYVPIMTGCNNFCAYCVVPYARGREVSRPAEEIMEEIKCLAEKKFQEITLLGQNVNSYKYGNYHFPDLLDKLAKKYPQIKFKFISSHPKDFGELLMRAIGKNKNISREIHLPIQAGSNKVLKAMNRPYTQKYYLDLIEKIKKTIPGASFTTDIIVGFPGETNKDFAQSIKVFKKVGYNEAYINKYSPRPGTAAWDLKETVSLAEKKRREKILRIIVDYGKKK